MQLNLSRKSLESNLDKIYFEKIQQTSMVTQHLARAAKPCVFRGRFSTCPIRSAGLSIEVDLLWQILSLADFATEATGHAVLTLGTEAAVCVDGTTHHVAPETPMLRI